MFLIATGECAVMSVMQRLTDAPRKMGIGRGDDYPFRWFGLILDPDNSSEGMFGFDPALFIARQPQDFVSMIGDKLTRQ